ncbi:LOW QUALITY PROTEIN: hypothetical protein PHPALM_31788 [Phytophthora palmivora]|uniref:Uncharacterized protein n=1 Tax=Phytophthora palmivora TaxID=4796 RepID=A0A2P4X1Q5_9STRA|nr:LOW QUALITY PROTEIN: hypothetical protein PHPALM_31788 [Phytophthora palmivora]
MNFTSATLALYQVQAYAISTMKSVKIQRRGGVDNRIVCSGAANGGPCPFSFNYTNAVLECGLFLQCVKRIWTVSVAKPTTKQIAQLPTFVSAVNADNILSASALISLVSSRDGISLVGQERSVYRAKRTVMGLTLKGLKKSYELIEHYFDAFKKLNPGSTAVMERDDQDFGGQLLLFNLLFGRKVAINVFRDRLLSFKIRQHAERDYRIRIGTVGRYT